MSRLTWRDRLIEDITPEQFQGWLAPWAGVVTGRPTAELPRVMPMDSPAASRFPAGITESAHAPRRSLHGVRGRIGHRIVSHAFSTKTAGLTALAFARSQVQA
jgi:hypothetical protein